MWQGLNSLCWVPEGQARRARHRGASGLAGPGGYKNQGGARSKTDVRDQDCCPGHNTASGIWPLSKFAYICIHYHFHRRASTPWLGLGEAHFRSQYYSVV